MKKIKTPNAQRKQAWGENSFFPAIANNEKAETKSIRRCKAADLYDLPKLTVRSKSTPLETKADFKVEEPAKRVLSHLELSQLAEQRSTTRIERYSFAEVKELTQRRPTLPPIVPTPPSMN